MYAEKGEDMREEPPPDRTPSPMIVGSGLRRTRLGRAGPEVVPAGGRNRGQRFDRLGRQWAIHVCSSLRGPEENSGVANGISAQRDDIPNAKSRIPENQEHRPKGVILLNPFRLYTEPEERPKVPKFHPGGFVLVGPRRTEVAQFIQVEIRHVDQPLVLREVLQSLE